MLPPRFLMRKVAIGALIAVGTVACQEVDARTAADLWRCRVPGCARRRGGCHETPMAGLLLEASRKMDKAWLLMLNIAILWKIAGDTINPWKMGPIRKFQKFIYTLGELVFGIGLEAREKRRTQWDTNQTKKMVTYMKKSCESGLSHIGILNTGILKSILKYCFVVEPTILNNLKVNRRLTYSV